MSRPVPAFKTLLWRGCRKKCPQCGQGPLYRRWMKLHERCPVCGLQYLANQGDLFGMLLFVDRVLFLIPLVVLIYFRLWHPNQTVFFLFGGALIFVLVFTMPHRNGTSLAVDYWIRRRNEEPQEGNSREAEPK